MKRTREGGVKGWVMYVFVCFWRQHDLAPCQTPEGFINGDPYFVKCLRCDTKFTSK